MIGSSGCGKTTLISCVMGLAQLDSGKICIFDEPVTKLNKTRIGYMPQESALITGFTVREMIWFYGTIFGLDKKKIDERFWFLRKLLELPDEDQMIQDCSGGQQRRISFALSLVHEPEVLILDEPTVGLDPLLRNKIWDYLVELTQSHHVTVLLSTHYIEEARQSTCVGVMRNGTMIAEDSPLNILRLCDETSLQEAFLKLSAKQEHDRTNKSKMFKVGSFSTQSGISECSATHFECSPRKNSLEQSQWRIVYALLVKNLIQVIRKPE